MKIKNNLKLFCIFILILFSISNLNAAEKNYYQDIVNDWNKIFLIKIEMLDQNFLNIF